MSYSQLPRITNLSKCIGELYVANHQQKYGRWYLYYVAVVIIAIYTHASSVYVLISNDLELVSAHNKHQRACDDHYLTPLVLSDKLRRNTCQELKKMYVHSML